MSIPIEVIESMCREAGVIVPARPPETSTIRGVYSHGDVRREMIRIWNFPHCGRPLSYPPPDFEKQRLRFYDALDGLTGGELWAAANQLKGLPALLEELEIYHSADRYEPIVLTGETYHERGL